MKKVLPLIFMWFLICDVSASGDASEKLNLPEFGTCGGLFAPDWTMIQLGIEPNTSFFSSSTRVYGFSLHLLMGLFNDSGAGVQVAPVALVNEESFSGVGFALFNVVYEKLCGLQVGVVNFARENFGMQGGIMNLSLGCNIFQLGVFNAASGGLQIGLINSNRNSIFPVMIGVNFSRGNKSDAECD